MQELPKPTPENLEETTHIIKEVLISTAAAECSFCPQFFGLAEDEEHLYLVQVNSYALC